MSVSRKLIVRCVLALLCCMSAVMSPTQSPGPGEPQCFSIHVKLNGKLVKGPQTITLRTERNDNIVSAERGCFRVPRDVLAMKDVDVLFMVPGNNIHLTAIRTGFLAGNWDVELEDKTFNKEVDLPKHVRVREACAVLFHVGEPETQVSQTQCRTALSSKE